MEVALRWAKLAGQRWRSPGHVVTMASPASEKAMPYTIAIVEDDPDQRRNYSEAIAGKGFEVVAYGTREDASEGFARCRPDLAILDIILEREVDGGFQLCRELLQRYPQVPILFLTERIDEIDRISGLRLGAWDYQPKPISLNFLAERVSSLLRLVELRAGEGREQFQSVTQALQLSEDTMQAVWRGRALELTLTEFRLLARLVRSPGQAVSYESLMNATIQQCVTNNTINTHMRNMRRKFRQLDGDFNGIRNEYGFGYRWREPL